MCARICMCVCACVHMCAGSLGSRRWSSLARWRLRELNELPHYVTHRLAASTEAAARYVAQFPSPLAIQVRRGGEGGRQDTCTCMLGCACLCLPHIMHMCGPASPTSCTAISFVTVQCTQLSCNAWSHRLCVCYQCLRPLPHNAQVLSSCTAPTRPYCCPPSPSTNYDTLRWLSLYHL